MSENDQADPYPSPHEMVAWLYRRAHDVFERAGEALDRRDLVSHTELYEEHLMLSALIREVEDGRTLA